MADYYTQGTMSPFPREHLTTNDLMFFQEQGVTVFLDRDGTAYLYHEESVQDADEVVEKLQEIVVRSAGKIPYIHWEVAYTCSSMRPEAFGGSAWFITATETRWIGTNNWIAEQIASLL